MNNVRLASLLIVSVLVVSPLQLLAAQSVYVSSSGSDANLGTINAPFKTIAKASSVLTSGSTCFLREGVYRESLSNLSSGTAGNPITFSSYQGENAVISGGELISNTWEKWPENEKIWRVKTDTFFTQLFLNGVPMIEAWWPNMHFHENWNEKKKWARTDKGTIFGRVKSANVAALNLSLNGGRVFIKVGKGNECFSRTIFNHAAGSETFRWDTAQFLNNQPATGEDGDEKKMSRAGLDNNEFFVIGVPGLLDAPHEWFYDSTTKYLYLYPPENIPDPNHAAIEWRKREYIINDATGLCNVAFSGITFKAGTVVMKNCSNILFTGCKFLYPSYRHIFFNRIVDRQSDYFVPEVTLIGDSITVRSCELGWAVDYGMFVGGSGNLVENSVFHDVSLHGKHPGPALQIEGGAKAPSYLRNNTVYNCGAVGIRALVNNGPVSLERSHIFNAGIYCVDVAAFYIPIGQMGDGAQIAYNWIHDNPAIGTRCDRYGRGITVHHNVVWGNNTNCKWQGYQFNIYNNTYVSTMGKGLRVVLQDANDATPAGKISDFLIKNNVTFDKIYEGFSGPNIPDNGQNISNNLRLAASKFSSHFVSAAPAAPDWRPKNASSLVDAGVEIPGITDGFKGSKPDIGAYESGGEYWHPGADWLPYGLTVPKTMPEATMLAKKLQRNWSAPDAEVPTTGIARRDGPVAQRSPHRSSGNLIVSGGKARYSLESRAHVRVDLYTLDGRLVETMVNSIGEAGTHSVTPSSRPGAGSYIISLRSGESRINRRILFGR